MKVSVVVKVNLILDMHEYSFSTKLHAWLPQINRFTHISMDLFIFYLFFAKMVTHGICKCESNLTRKKLTIDCVSCYARVRPIYVLSGF